MKEERFAAVQQALQSHGPLAAFNVAAVAEAIDTVRQLAGTEAGRRTIQTRQGEWKSWDPEIFGVDEATEGGYIRRLRELGRPVILLSEESDRVEINTDAEGSPIYGVSDPFDGSWLFKRQLPLWWYTSLALYADDFSPISAATGDVTQGLIAFADQSGAYLVQVADAHVAGKQRLDEAYRVQQAGPPVENLDQACVASYGLKPRKFLRPLVEQYGPLIYEFKMYYPNGGPFGFVDVATGQVDVYLALRQPYVDVFSALEIARAAGLVISDLEGNPFRLQTDDCKTAYDVVVSRTPSRTSLLQGVLPEKGA